MDEQRMHLIHQIEAGSNDHAEQERAATAKAEAALAPLEAKARALREQQRAKHRAEGLREAADFYDQLLTDMGDTVECDPRYWTAIRDVAKGLRRRADEQQQPAGPPPVADRGAGYRQAADAIERMPGYPRLVLPEEVVAELRRLADETPQPESGPTESTLYQVVGDWGTESASDAEEARAAVAAWLHDHPHSGARAEQRVYREWPDGSEFHGPWTDLPDPAAVVSQPSKEG